MRDVRQNKGSILKVTDKKHSPPLKRHWSNFLTINAQKASVEFIRRLKKETVGKKALEEKCRIQVRAAIVGSWFLAPCRPLVCSWFMVVGALLVTIDWCLALLPVKILNTLTLPSREEMLLFPRIHSN